MDDPLRAAEYAIGFESLRFIIQVEAAKAGSQAALARALELPIRPLRRFLAGGDPTPFLWRALSDHVRGLDDKPLAPLGLLGLAVTTATLPERLRREARIRMAEAVADLYPENQAPGWVYAVLNLWD